MDARTFAVLGSIFFATAAAGCSGTDAGIDDDEVGSDEAESTSAPPNKGIAGALAKKVCAKTTRALTLYYQPDGSGGVVGVIPKAQYVLVQKAPGRVGARVWIDPDVFGLDDKEFAERCRTTADNKPTKDERIGRRGWGLASSLVAKSAGDSIPSKDNVMPYDDGDPFKKANAKTYFVKDQCDLDPDATYPGSDPTRGTHYVTYGTKGTNGIYVNFSTTEVDGGGISFGYAMTGQPFHVTYSRKDKKQLSGSPISWAYGFTKIGDERVWGWVVKNCLRK
jgi:hypothetical protein